MRTHDKVQVLLYRNPKDPEFLLLLTNQGEKSFWQGVTGGVEDTDSDLNAAARREVAEELGIYLLEEELDGPVHNFRFKTSLPDQFGEECHEYVFSAEVPQNVKITLSDEHQEYGWYHFLFAIDLIKHIDPKIALGKVYINLLEYQKISSN